MTVSVPVVIQTLAWVSAALAVFAAALAMGLALRPAPYVGDTWEHTVVQGESVWGLANSLGLERSLEDVVTDIYALNDMTGSLLHPGQQILLPVE